MSNNGNSHSNVSTQKKLSVDPQKVFFFSFSLVFPKFIVHLREKSKESLHAYLNSTNVLKEMKETLIF